MAVVFETALRNHMLSLLDTFAGAGVNTKHTVTAYGSQGGVGTLIAQADITLASAVNAVRSSSASAVITVPAGNTVRSIGLTDYDPDNSGGTHFQIGWKNTPTNFVFDTIGTITITSVKISIVNAS